VLNVARDIIKMFPGYATCLWVEQVEIKTLVIKNHKRGVPSAVSRQFPSAATRVRTRVKFVGSMVDRAELGQVLSEYFDFSCHSFSPIITP
jgi:hypothetical protein